MPVSADLENGFGDDPEAAAETIRQALAAGLSGGSIEDYSMRRRRSRSTRSSRRPSGSAAAAEVAHAGPVHFVLTARAENHIRGRDDLADTIARLQAFQAAGADVLYAPGLMDLGDIASLVQAVDRPVNVIVRPGGPTVAELAEAGVARISVGGSFAWVARGRGGRRGPGAAASTGTLGFLEQAVEGGRLARRALRRLTAARRQDGTAAEDGGLLDAAVGHAVGAAPLVARGDDVEDAVGERVDLELGARRRGRCGPRRRGRRRPARR